MKNFIYVTFLSIVAFSCNPNQDAMKNFEENTKTMDILFESFANESVDYSKFADDVSIVELEVAKYNTQVLFLFLKSLRQLLDVAHRMVFVAVVQQFTSQSGIKK